VRDAAAARRLQVTPRRGAGHRPGVLPAFPKRRWLFFHNCGFVTLNDGLAVASQLAKYLNGLVARRDIHQLRRTQRGLLVGAPTDEQ
jgi:hypothetical protein